MTFTPMDESTAAEVASFDPDHPTKPLEDFEPLVRRVLARPQRL